MSPSMYCVLPLSASTKGIRHLTCILHFLVEVHIQLVDLTACLTVIKILSWLSGINMLGIFSVVISVIEV